MKFVTSNVLGSGVTVKKNVLVTLHRAVGACIPLLAASVSVLVCGACLLGGSLVVGILESSVRLKFLDKDH
jgi:hypothetical protein